MPTTKERRLTEQLILYWNGIKGERNFPAYEDVVIDDIENIWTDCFITKADKYMQLGNSIKKEMTGCLSKILSDSTAHFHTVSTSKQPLLNESECFDTDKTKIMYRQILLPLGKTDDNVEYLLGGIRYKKYASE